MKTQNTPDNKSPEAVRLEGVRLFIKLHCRSLITQGTVVAGWRESGGRRLGPYYRLAYRQDGLQRSLYLGKSEWLADQVRQLLAIVHKPFRDAQAFQRLQASARAGLRKAKTELRQQLARVGLLLKSFEIRGLDTLRRMSRWGQLALVRGVPCPRFLPLLELGGVPRSLGWREILNPHPLLRSG